MKLYSYQEKAVEELEALLHKRQAVLLEGDTGVGKTHIGVAVAQRISNPLVILCPRQVVSQWNTVCVDAGVKPLLVNSHEWMRYKNRYMELSTSSPMSPKPFLIIDEAHRFGGNKTGNSRMLRWFYDRGHAILLLSATLCSTPLRLGEVGRCLGLYHTTSEHYRFLMAHGVRKNFFGHLEFKDSLGIHMDDIHCRLFPKAGIRIRIIDLPEFPENHIYTQVLDIGLNDSQLKGLDIAWDRLHEMGVDVCGAEGISPQSAKMIDYHRLLAGVEGARVSVYPEMIADRLAEGRSVVVFMRYRASLLALESLLRAQDIETRVIVGGQGQEAREAAIEAFQGNLVHVILCMLTAGGVGLSLHDVHGTRPRTAFLSPVASATQYVQSSGRIARINSKSKSVQVVVYIAGSREEALAKQMDEQIKSLSTLNDGQMGFSSRE
jgi:primosomal protein N'